MRGQPIDVYAVSAGLALPAGTPLAQQQITGINVAITQVDPGCQAEAGAVQAGVIAHPAAQPWTHVDVVGLHPDATIIEYAVAVIEIEPHLNYAVLAGKARQTDFTLGPVAVVFVDPGESRNRQFSMLAGRGAETDGAIPQVEVVKLTQKEFINLRRTEAVFLFVVVE